MINKEENAVTYSIGDLVLISGLTDRTLRNYLSLGILRGEKENGAWRFTPEQVEVFLRDAAVRPSILAKKNALVYDFLLNTQKTKSETCVILDLPGENGWEISGFFCDAIRAADIRDVQFSFESFDSVPRVILKGDAAMVRKLMDRFYSR